MQMCMVGRTRHGLWTKYVDAYRASWMLAGDYSPRTVRILPRQNPFGKPSFASGVSAALGPVDAKTLSFGLDRALPQVLFDQRLVLQETIGYQS